MALNKATIRDARLRPLNLRSLNNPRSAMVVGGTGVEFCHASVFAKVVEKALTKHGPNIGPLVT